VGVGSLGQLRGRRSESAGNQLDRVPERHVQERAGGLGGDAQRSPAPGEVLGQRRNVVPVQQIGDVGTVLGGDRRGGVLPGAGRPAYIDEVGWQQQVDPVRLAADLVVDPGQIGLQARRAVRGGAQHAEAPGAGDGSDNIPAVAEGKDRDVDA
jgi:hypothetical protein